MKKITIIHIDGHLSISKLDEGNEFDELQKAVGGYIESIPYFELFNGIPCEAYCNEEGKLDGLPVNHAATSLWEEQVPGARDLFAGDRLILTGDYLVGDVAIVQNFEVA